MKWKIYKGKQRDVYRSFIIDSTITTEGDMILIYSSRHKFEMCADWVYQVIVSMTYKNAEREKSSLRYRMALSADGAV